MGYIERLMETLKEACAPMKETTTITFGTVLDLLGRDDTEVTLHKTVTDGLTDSANSSLWETLEELPVKTISVSIVGSLLVWLDSEEAAEDEDKRAGEDG